MIPYQPASRAASWYATLALGRLPNTRRHQVSICKVRLLLLALATTLLLASCEKDPPAPTPDPTATTTTTQQVIGIAGTQFTLNGNPWLPQGVMLRGFVAPPAFSQQHDPNTYRAYFNYGEAELNAAKAYGADMLRFQVSQPGLDTLSSLHSANYVRSVIAAIKLARQHNFAVIISMQDEWLSGESPGTLHPLPTAATVRNWDLLTSVFGTDRGVMFELYSEPALRNTATNWQRWTQGDPGTTASTASVGMQTLITHLRVVGSQNVLLLDGLGTTFNTLEGVPAITDPLNRVAYAIHPYLHASTDESQWDTQFGIPSKTLPVLVTEWSARVNDPLGLGLLPSYQVAVDLLNYLRGHNIALGAGAFDIPGELVQSVPGFGSDWIPSNYDDYNLALRGDSLKNAGMLVHKDFTNHYSQPLTLADGL